MSDIVKLLGWVTKSAIIKLNNSFQIGYKVYFSFLNSCHRRFHQFLWGVPKSEMIMNIVNRNLKPLSVVPVFVSSQIPSLVLVPGRWGIVRYLTLRGGAPVIPPPLLSIIPPSLALSILPSVYRSVFVAVGIAVSLMVGWPVTPCGLVPVPPWPPVRPLLSWSLVVLWSVWLVFPNKEKSFLIFNPMYDFCHETAKRDGLKHEYMTHCWMFCSIGRILMSNQDMSCSIIENTGIYICKAYRKCP